MATQRLSMRKIREIVRMKSEGRSHREVAASLRLSVGVVSKIVKRAELAGVAWPAADQLKDSELEERIYGPPRKPGAQRPLPDPTYIHTERKKVGVTLELLHLEHLEQHPDGYRYTQFCEVYLWNQGFVARRSKHSSRVSPSSSTGHSSLCRLAQRLNSPLGK